jgi:hypothetical protein
MCTDAYRAALMRDLQRRANPAKDDLERCGVAPAGTAAGSGPAIALASDAAVVNGEAVDQR